MSVCLISKFWAEFVFRISSVFGVNFETSGLVYPEKIIFLELDKSEPIRVSFNLYVTASKIFESSSRAFKILESSGRAFMILNHPAEH